VKIIYGLNNLKRQYRKSVATIGIFDGVHIGHKAILEKVVRQAKNKNRAAVVLTFHPHPRKVMDAKSSKSTILSLQHRLELLRAIGIDLCVVIRFTPAFSKKSIAWFIKEILVRRLKTTTLIVGSRFKLGKEKLSVGRLERLISAYGLKFEVIPTRKYKAKVISSSLIRNLIKSGKLDAASKLLERAVAIHGTVTHGMRIGRALGFRTANINPHHEVIPPSGVYAVNVKVHKKYYKGVLNIGFRPTFAVKQKEPTIEVHIIGFNANLYNKPIELSFIKRIRPERHFKNRAALRKQIRKDILYKV
jgi:riboflavin kinase / FMN adenylyltransferase